MAHILNNQKQTAQINFREGQQGTFDFFHFVREQPILVVFIVFNSFGFFSPSILKTIILWTIHFHRAFSSSEQHPFSQKNFFCSEKFCLLKKKLFPSLTVGLIGKCTQNIVHRKPVYSCDLTK